MTGFKMITRSGIMFDLLNPKEEDINILDIIHSLSNTNRFAGHANYTVADHSVNVMYKVTGEEHKLAALLHDSAEAYVGDIIRPIKQMFPEINTIERNIHRLIAKKYGAPEKISQAVIDADNEMLELELDYFFVDKGAVNRHGYRLYDLIRKYTGEL